jgi:hypothetical protein
LIAPVPSDLEVIVPPWFESPLAGVVLVDLTPEDSPWYCFSLLFSDEILDGGLAHFPLLVSFLSLLSFLSSSLFLASLLSFIVSFESSVPPNTDSELAEDALPLTT